VGKNDKFPACVTRFDVPSFLNLKVKTRKASDKVVEVQTFIFTLVVTGKYRVHIIIGFSNFTTASPNFN
jgi:hypothetical protein